MIAVIINGDDFGFAPAINEGILRAHTDGCLTSASLSVAGPAAEEAARAARNFPDLGIGLHLTLIAERPVSPPEAIPSLIGPDGRFPPSAFAFARRWVAGQIRPQDVRREVRAQLERANELGVTLTHLDGEDHLHILPGAFEIVVEEMKRMGLMRLRIPLETVTVGKGGWTRRVLRCGLNLLAWRAARIARRAGFIFPDRFLGFLGAGHIDLPTLLARIDSLGEGITELSLHPAVGAGLPRQDFASWGYRWDVELAALVDPRVQGAFHRRGIIRLHYGQLPVS